MTHRLRLSIVATALLGLGGLAGAGQGALHARCTIFAAPAGHGSGRSAASPTSLGSAVSRAGAGSVICLKRGVYTTFDSVTLERSGRPGAPITLTALTSGVLIRYAGGTRDGGVVQTTFCKPWCASHDLVIENLSLDGGNRMGTGVFVREGSHNVTVRNCLIRNMGSSGIALNAADYVRAENNRVFHTGYGHGWGSGISLWYGGPDTTYGGPSAGIDGAPGYHNFITGNVVSGSYDSSAYHTDGDGIVVDGGVTPPALIANNLVYENGGAGIAVFRNGGRMSIVNNTAYANGLAIADYHTYSSQFAAVLSSHVEWRNNIAYSGRPRWHTYASSFSGVSLAGNISFNGPLLGLGPRNARSRAGVRYVNPRFDGPLPRLRGAAPWAGAVPAWRIGRAFRLRAHSPARNAGIR
jgi:hypothetical protein